MIEMSRFRRRSPHLGPPTNDGSKTRAEQPEFDNAMSPDRVSRRQPRRSGDETAGTKPSRGFEPHARYPQYLYVALPAKWVTTSMVQLWVGSVPVTSRVKRAASVFQASKMLAGFSVVSTMSLPAGVAP